jgi:hypothetical protein
MRSATPEQKAKAAERRAQMRLIARKIRAMPEADRMQLVGDWPTTIEGHKLSLFNACMIIMQGGASVVGGFQQWRKAGRAVRKGEHGKAIWFPIGTGKNNETADESEVSEANEIRFGLRHRIRHLPNARNRNGGGSMSAFIHHSRLAAKVAGQNRVNAEANTLERELVEIFRPFIGKKILTHGGLTAKIKPLIPKRELPFRLWRAPSSYTLSWKLDVTEHDSEHSVCYREAWIHVGKLNGYTLESLCDPQTRRTDYTIAEISDKRERLKQYEEAYRQARSALDGFGEYDQ